MVAPAPPSPDVAVAVGDNGGGDAPTVRWCGEPLESAASRTLTSHSSPCDVSDDEPHGDNRNPQPPFSLYPRSSKVMDDASDFYRSVETPRATGNAGSIRSIQIQIESGHQSGDAMSQGTTPSSARRRRICGQGVGGATSSSWTAHKRPLRFDANCRTALVQTLCVVAPPATVLVLLHLSVSFYMLFVLNVVVALAAWEWSWWSFRIRRRLLLPFQHEPATANVNIDPTASTSMTPRDRQTSMEELLDAVLNEQVVAVTKITKGPTSASKYFVAAGIALLVTAVIVPFVVIFADSILTKHSSVVGKNVLICSSITALLSSVFCACLTATPADAFIVFVYEVCFVVSSLNSFLSHHEHLVHDPELLDAMYVLLVGACAIVVWRIVSSKEVMESTIMAMTDILGLAYLVAPMMAMVEFLGHPEVGDHDDIVGTFFVVVSAAEAAYRLNEMIKHTYPHALHCLRRPVVKHVSATLGYDSLALSFVFGAVGAILSMLCFHGYIVRWQDVLIFFGTIFMSQFCRLALDSMKALAKVDAIKYQPWLGGCMDLVNPYLLAMIVFHPYVKALIKG